MLQLSVILATHAPLHVCGWYGVMILQTSVSAPVTHVRDIPLAPLNVHWVCWAPRNGQALLIVIGIGMQMDADVRHFLLSIGSAALVLCQAMAMPTADYAATQRLFRITVLICAIPFLNNWMSVCW